MAPFEDSFAVNIYVALGLMMVAAVAGLFYISVTSIAASIVLTVTFVVWRHRALKAVNHADTKGRVWMEGRSRYHPTTAHLPGVYFLYVLGSGGHTSEMFEMIRRKFRGQKNFHRRYVSTSGDLQSAAAIATTEKIINDAYVDGAAGTWDHFEVKRARAVHQPFYTAWYTSIWSALSIIGALTSQTTQRPYLEHGNSYKYPHVIITNGPGTGFVLCFVAHLLKIFYLAPQNRLKVVYIESWAHTQTLSLTGKLFHWTGIANLFCVQHKSLAEKFGKHYLGLVAARTEPVG